MGASRPHEALSVLRALEDLACADPLNVRGVLATLLTLDGAIHERSGATALFCDEAAAGAEGARNLATLPEALKSAVENVIAAAVPAPVEFALDEDEPLFGPGGTAGTAEVWLEPVTGELRDRLREVREALLRGEGLVVELAVAGGEAGRRRHFPPEHSAARACYDEGAPELEEKTGRDGLRRVFSMPLIPMGKALILGSGEDARRLAELLDRLGFVVTVADHRPGHLHGPGWDRARWQMVEGGWDAARAVARPDADTYVVVMTHSHRADGRALKGALLSRAMKMMTDPSVMKLLSNPKVASLFIQGLQLKSQAEEVWALQLRKLADSLNLATREEVESLKAELAALADRTSPN